MTLLSQLLWLLIGAAGGGAKQQSNPSGRHSQLRA
jgi:hypothetical protein